MNSPEKQEVIKKEPPEEVTIEFQGRLFKLHPTGILIPLEKPLIFVG